MATFKQSTQLLGLSLLALSTAFVASAQNSPLSVSPSQLTFNVQSSSTTSQNLVIFSNNGSAAFTATATSSGNWLTVTPQAGTSPAVVSVTINPASLTMGSYAGFINVTSGTTTTTVPVILNYNTSGTSSLSAAPGLLSFSFGASTSAPQSQQLNISSAGSISTSFTVTTSTSSGGTWLAVNPNAASTPSSLSVSVNPANLQAGTYYGAIALNPPGTTGLVIPVQVTVAGTASLNVSPQLLSFAYQIGATTPVAQTLTLTSSTGAAISFTATASTSSCGNNWLIVSPQSSATPSTLSVQINPLALQAGSCTGSINISAPGASNTAINIPVSLLVSTNPLLQVPTSGTTFNYQLGTAIPASQTVQITSSSTALPFTVIATPVSNGPNFLTVTPATGVTPQALTLTVNPTVLSGLAPNTYAETVTVSSTGAGNPSQTFTVTLNVSTNPMLNTSQQAVTFNYQLGQSKPSSQIVTLNSTGAPLSYQVSTSTTNCNGFLTATPSSGTTQYQSGPASQIVIGVLTTGLTTAQTCTGTVTVSVPGSTLAPTTIPVTLNVSSTPLLNLSPTAINVVAVPGSGAFQQTVALTSTDLTTAINFTATAATNPPGLTWLSVAPNTGTSPSSLNVLVNPINLPAGIYTGTINVSSTTTGIPSQSIPVTLTVASGTVTVTPATLSFNQALGGTAPAAQTIQISGIPTGTTVGATTTLFNGSSWLTVSTSGNTLTITPTGGQLAQGTYSGVVTVFVPGAANSPLYIPVTYTVGGASTFNFTPGTVSFNYQAGAAVPAPQTLQLSSASGAITYNAVAVAPPGSPGGILFITVSPASGATPGALTVSLNQSVISTLAIGIYTNNISLTSPSAPGVTQTIPVTITVTSAGPSTITSILSGASFQTGAVAPGELVSIFGTNIGPATAVGLTLNSNGMVTTTLGNVSVTFNGTPAPLTYVSANQINAVVPYEVGGVVSATVVVTTNGVASAPVQVNVANSAPSIFTLTQNGSGQGAIVNQTGSINGASNPAAKGSVVAIYATGGGALNPTALTGSVTSTTGSSLPLTSAPVTVTIGGVPAQVQYSGAAPGIVSGVLQINVTVPSGVASSNQLVVVSVGGVSSPAVATIAIQ